MKFDLFVIGSGPAGQRAAVQASKLGKTVGICERREVVGGAWINTGTIPSKTFREAVLTLTGFAQRGMYGAASAVPTHSITMDHLLSRCRTVIQHEIDVIRAQMQRNGVTLVTGAAKFVGPTELSIRSGAGTLTKIEAERIVIATGTTPAAPDGLEVDGKTLIDSDGILTLQELPRTLTIVGAGVIGVEYATMFSVLGVKVTLVDKRARLLEFVDGEVSAALAYHMRSASCTLRLSEDVARVALEKGKAVATLKSGKRIVSDVMLYSIGRIGATGDLDLPAAGLAADARGRLAVNDCYQTSQPHIYAVGDVIGFPALASTSLEQGRQAACHAFGAPLVGLPKDFPYGIYCIPEISMVGRTEEELMASGTPYEVGVARYKEIARGAILGDHAGLLKLLVHIETRKLLGIHIIGTAATELIHIGQAVMALDANLDYLVDSVFNYPTFAECYKVAALDAYNKITPRSVGARLAGSAAPA